MANTGVLTPQEAADVLRCHVMTIYGLLKSGELPAVRVGRHWRIRQETVDAFLAGEPR